MATESQKKIAKERIEKLFSMAEGSPRADRYVEMARKIAMRYNIRIPPRLKRKFCSKCYKFLTPNNSTVRTSRKEKAVIVKCLNCGAVMRYPLKRAQKAI